MGILIETGSSPPERFPCITNVITNENALWSVLLALHKAVDPNQSMVCGGTTQNLMAAYAVRASEVHFIEHNPAVALAIAAMLSTTIYAITTGDFWGFWNESDSHQQRRWLIDNNVQEDRKNIIERVINPDTGNRHVLMAASSIISGHLEKQSLSRRNSLLHPYWIFDNDAYAYIQKLVADERIFIHQGDISDSLVYESIKKTTKVHCVGLSNLSNIESFLAPKELIRTWSLQLGLRPDLVMRSVNIVELYQKLTNYSPDYSVIPGLEPLPESIFNFGLQRLESLIRWYEQAQSSKLPRTIEDYILDDIRKGRAREMSEGLRLTQT